jgi:prepilin-type N-terminal cleavage/methylation domain-containing protein
MRESIAMSKTKQRGFTLIEVVVATGILLAGVVAVAQLVPVAVTANNGNRRDSTATVIAQRELSQFMEQPLTTPGPYTDALGHICGIGDATQPGVTVGSPVIIGGNRPIINFAAAKVANYNFTTAADPEDPYRAQYDVRWAVITGGNGTSASSRRFIISARQINTQSYVLPLTIDAMVQR